MPAATGQASLQACDHKMLEMSRAKYRTKPKNWFVVWVLKITVQSCILAERKCRETTYSLCRQVDSQCGWGCGMQTHKTAAFLERFPNAAVGQKCQRAQIQGCNFQLKSIKLKKQKKQNLNNMHLPNNKAATPYFKCRQSWRTWATVYHHQVKADSQQNWCRNS